MSPPWITVNSNLLTGVTLINMITPTKFNLLLKHIIHANSNEIFTREEKTKLSDSLKLSQDDVELLILSIQHIFKQASKIITKPTDLQEQLIKNLEFQSEKAELFVKSWMEATNRDFDLENTKKVTDLSWELNLQSASTLNHREKSPKARIQMQVTNVDQSESQCNENVTLELDESELMQFYSVLESIQSKLDSIN